MRKRTYPVLARITEDERAALEELRKSHLAHLGLGEIVGSALQHLLVTYQVLELEAAGRTTEAMRRRVALWDAMLMKRKVTLEEAAGHFLEVREAERIRAVGLLDDDEAA